MVSGMDFQIFCGILHPVFSYGIFLSHVDKNTDGAKGGYND